MKPCEKCFYMQKIKSLELENEQLKKENERIISSIHHKFRAIWATLKGLHLLESETTHKNLWEQTFNRAEKYLDDVGREYISGGIRKLKTIILIFFIISGCKTSKPTATEIFSDTLYMEKTTIYSLDNLAPDPGSTLELSSGGKITRISQTKFAITEKTPIIRHTQTTTESFPSKIKYVDRSRENSGNIIKDKSRENSGNTIKDKSKENSGNKVKTGIAPPWWLWVLLAAAVFFWIKKKLKIF